MVAGLGVPVFRVIMVVQIIYSSFFHTWKISAFRKFLRIFMVCMLNSFFP